MILRGDGMNLAVFLFNADKNSERVNLLEYQWWLIQIFLSRRQKCHNSLGRTVFKEL